MEKVNFGISEIKLDLMDWKTTEKIAEDAIREHTMVVQLNELARKEAKKMIKKFGGKTSEEERVIEKKKFEEAKKNTA